jgi:uncharacterized protein YciI
MSAFAIWCHDRPDSSAVRTASRDAHLAHVEAHIDRYLVAGPLRDAAGEVAGSLLIVTADNVEDARAFLGTDPYFTADLWQSIDIRAFNPAAGDWVGGVTWR